MRDPIFAAAALVLVLQIGCAGHGFPVVADGDLNGPVSLTGTVFDPTGQPIRIADGLEKVGEFEATERRWAVMALIPFNGYTPWDITRIANDAMEEAGAEAIVNVSVEARGAPYLALASLLIVVPSYVDVTLRGDLVRRPD